MTAARRLRYCVAIPLAMLPVLSGCPRDQARVEDDRTGFIAAVGAGRTDPLWPILQTAAEEVRRTTRGVDVRAVAPEQVSPNLQVQLLQQLAEEGVRGVCVQVTDARALARPLKTLQDDGVVVITMMHQVDAAEPYLHSGLDEAAIGAALADAAAAQTPLDGTIGLLYATGDPLWQARRSGFGRRLSQYPRVTLLKELDCQADPYTAVRMLRSTMERFRGIDAWAAIDTWPLRPAPDGRPLLPEGCDLVIPGPVEDPVFDLVAGKYQAVVVADYHRIIMRALEMGVLAVDGQLVHERLFFAEPRIVTRESVDDFEREWLAWTGRPPKLAPAESSPEPILPGPIPAELPDGNR